MSLAATTPAASLKTLSAPQPARRSAFLAATLGWLVPGLGQVYVGRAGRGLVMLIAVGGLFYAGLRMTGYTCVNPSTYGLEFVAHVFLGGPTAVVTYMTQGLELSEPLPWFEAGRLYAAVAGLLNIVAICDALGEVLVHNDRVRAQTELRRRFLADRQRELDELVSARALAEAEATAGASAETSRGDGDEAADESSDGESAGGTPERWA